MKAFTSERKVKFVILSALVVLSRAVDIITTYVASPDLSSEINPLVRYFNLGWIGILGTQGLIVLVILYFLYYNNFYSYKSFPGEKGYSFKEFISYYYFNNKTSFYRLIYKFPTNKTASLFTLGYVFPRASIYFGFLLAALNLLTHQYSYYSYIANKFNLWLLPYFMALFTLLYYYYKFFKKEYKEYLALY